MRQNKGSSSTTSALTKVQAAYILKVTKKINSNSLSRYFQQPVDPERDGAEDYFEKIQRPMDLGTVLQNLHENKYPNVEKWREDMKLIWDNAMTYNARTSPLYAIAEDLAETFRKQTEVIPRSQAEEWLLEMRRQEEKVARILQARPDATVPQIQFK